MRGDGNGWTTCARGHRHWGRYGAAGLLVARPDPVDGITVLLQLRAGWSHHGGTWGLPGGARDSDESPHAAALREAGEEVGIDPGGLRIVGLHGDDHGGWCYDTVLATADRTLDARPTGEETDAVRWLPVELVTGLTLHPGFAASWPPLRLAVEAAYGVRP